MGAVRAEVIEVVFAGAVLTLFGSAAALVLRRLSRRTMLWLGAIVAAAAATGWVLFALDPGQALGAAAGGLAVCAAAQFGLLGLERLLAHGRDVESQLAGAEERLEALVRQEIETRAAELERTLTLARAESLSRLVEEERRIAEERRVAVHDRER